MKEVPLSEVKDDLSEYLDLAEERIGSHHSLRETSRRIDWLRMRR